MATYYVMDLSHKYNAPSWEANKFAVEADTVVQAAGKAAALLLHRRASTDGLYEIVVSTSPDGATGTRYTVRARVEKQTNSH